MAAAVDDAAGALLAVWEAAREYPTNPLSTAQLRAVMVVERNDGINLRRLATELSMLLSSASRLCDRLEAAGMLEREPGRVDRREISLHLTPQGRRFLTGLRADRRRRLTEVLSGMTPQGRAALIQGLTEFEQVSAEQQAAREEPGPEPPPGASVPRAREQGSATPPGVLRPEVGPAAPGPRTRYEDPPMACSA